MKSPLVLTRRLGTAHGLVVRRGLVQGRGQFVPQSFAGHLEDVTDPHFARSRFQVQAGAAVEIKDVALAIDERADRDKLLQKRAFGQLPQGRPDGTGGRAVGP